MEETAVGDVGANDVMNCGKEPSREMHQLCLWVGDDLRSRRRADDVGLAGGPPR